jgi:hypothetical protein
MVGMSFQIACHMLLKAVPIIGVNQIGPSCTCVISCEYKFYLAYIGKDIA